MVQIILNGYAVGGQKFVAAFASFMRICTSIAEGSELKYDKHKLHLLACAPLPLVDGDAGNENEESMELNAEAHVDYFQKTFFCFITIHGFCASVQIVLL